MEFSLLKRADPLGVADGSLSEPGVSWCCTNKKQEGGGYEISLLNAIL